MYSIKQVDTKNGELTFINVELNDIKATFLDYGATIYDIETKDENGTFESVLLKHQKLEDYFENDIYLNATVGPLSGRTKNATFELNGETIHLDKNFKDTANLHSGSAALSYKVFDYAVIEHETYTRIMYTYTTDEASPFKGIQTYQITYVISGSSVEIEFKAITSEDTVINLTNHAYFNLSGNMKKQVLDQTLYVNASNKLSTDSFNVPFDTETIKDTYLDFTKPKTVKESFFDGIYDLKEFGIDNQLLLDSVGYLIKQVVLSEPDSKRTLEVYTTYPVVVLYTHNFVSKALLSNGKHDQHMGICFEAQFESNGINIPKFNDSILRKGEEYLHKTLYKFGIK